MSKRDIIEVDIHNAERELKIYSQDDCFVFQFLDSNNPCPELRDFAVWCFLPIAMAANRDLHILGKGTKTTLENARRLSEIWSIRRPDLFAAINTSFQQIEEKEFFPFFNSNRHTRSLMFYSGGIDSTYTLLSRLSQGKSQDLLTIQGMEYKLDDHERFIAAKTKTEQLTESSCENRFFARSNGYNIYSKYGIPSEIAFVFLLAAVGFAYYRSHKNGVLAADNSLAEQFLAFPEYGSNFASNQYIDSGYFRLETDGAVFRAEKLSLIAENQKALKAISFCKSYSTRPENCGICSKCVRTKLTFIAALGKIPAGVFINADFSKSMIKQKLSKSKNFHFIEIAQIYCNAKKNGCLDKLPGIEKEFVALIAERRKRTIEKKSEKKSRVAFIKGITGKIGSIAKSVGK